ncbi:anaerobic ribonucleoside-triphosphate reductase activating protein [Christensenellaceae bacterium OttesenSCG-928-L17]|nr:anaerobic ribonucleoside-triphosphate reductase activating protein [Christensenellaceae bacterium OttesenSCG-928-L17]
MMLFGGLQRCSTIDFPGRLSCVLFARGCDLNCFYCHNRALLNEGENLPMEEIFSFLSNRIGKLDGVVVSGGEPTRQKGLAEFLHAVRDMGFVTKLDTNGQHPDVVEALLAKNLLDYVAVDLKAENADYAWVCGKENGLRQALTTIEILRLHGVAYEGRTTLYPGLGMVGLVQLMQGLPPLPCYRLNTFRMPEDTRPEDALLLRRTTLRETELDAAKEDLKKLQPNVCW